MSAIGGIFSRDSAPPDVAVLHRMSTFLMQSGPDGEQIERTAQVAMLLRPFYTDSMSRQNGRPLLASDGSLVTWNGRLDNRAELEALLPEVKGDPDPSLVLAAYRRWGIDAFAKLIGDFALALWDPRTQRLILATDALAVRRLYYHVGPRTIYWSSQVRALIDAAELPLDFDDEHIAGFLVRPLDLSHSPFKAARVLEGGHALVVEDGKEPRVHQYWSPDPQREIRYSKDEDYEEHFREVFREAVACRMQADGPIFVDLSGGLDSSSIVCVADEVLKAGKVDVPGMTTVSWVYDESASSDERRFSDFVEEQRGEKGLHLREDDHPSLHRPRFSSTFRPDVPEGQLTYMARNDHQWSHMQAAGSRVLLRGFGGDQVMWSEIGDGPAILADLVVQKRFLDLGRLCWDWSRALRQTFVKTFWGGAVWPLLSREMQTRLPLDWLQDSPDALYSDRVLTPSRRLGPDGGSLFSLPSQTFRYLMTWEMAGTMPPDLYLTEGCAEIRYPFFDRRLVEFALAVPAEQMIRPGETRSLMRRGLRGTLPEAIRKRKSKNGPAEAFYRALVREWPWISEMFDDPLAASYGFVNHDAVRETLTRARHGINTAPLLRVLCLEFWLRSVVGDDAAGRCVTTLERPQLRAA